MGIKDLWSILQPFSERKPLYELQGKKVAIDLSGWICQAQCIAEYDIQPRMYLRNLYFRTCFMLLHNITPIFVLEGKAPSLKYKTIAARNAIQFKGSKPREKGIVQNNKGRTRFDHVLKQCEEMLRYMGLACITGTGEAEALCAHLNAEGLVDGCISQDSDCFAYGAQIVYRNFSISQQGLQAASGGSVDIYDLNKPKEAIDFGRNKVIVLALICGSDYNEGVHGIGKDSAVKLFANVSDADILERVRSWRADNDSSYAKYEELLNNRNICSSCGHSGKLQAHNKSGCSLCSTKKSCDFSKFRDKRLEIKNELSIRKKALEDPNFPDENLVKEFLSNKEIVMSVNLKWCRPDVIKFVNFTVKYLQWEEIYCFEKIIPILIRWQLNQKTSNEHLLRPDFIKKVRNPKGVPSFEIIWIDDNNVFEKLIPKEQFVHIELTQLFTTIEPQDLIKNIYPELVAQFWESKKKKPEKRKINKKLGESPLKKTLKKNTNKLAKKTSEKKASQDSVVELEKSFQDITIGKVRTIDSYFKKAVLNSLVDSNQHEDILAKKHELNNSNCSSLWDEGNADLSNILDDIMNRSLPEEVQRKINEFKSDEKIQVPHSRKNTSSTFFIETMDSVDHFELSLCNDDAHNDADSSLSSDSELEMQEDQDEEISSSIKSNANFRNWNKTVELAAKNNGCDIDEFSFTDHYVPLFERLRTK